MILQISTILCFTLVKLKLIFTVLRKISFPNMIFLPLLSCNRTKLIAVRTTHIFLYLFSVLNLSSEIYYNGSNCQKIYAFFFTWFSHEWIWNMEIQTIDKQYFRNYLRQKLFICDLIWVTICKRVDSRYLLSPLKHQTLYATLIFVWPNVLCLVDVFWK